MSVKCTAIIVGTKEDTSKHFTNMFKEFQKNYMEQRFCDVTFIVEGTEIKAHKHMVMGGIGYFEKNFRKDGKRAMEDVVTIYDMNAKCFRQCLDFVYYGEIRNEDLENLMGILNAAKLLEIESMKEACYDAYKQWMTEDNCIQIHQILKLAKEDTEEDAKLTTGDDFIIENAEKILENTKSLEIMNFDTIKMILKCDEVSVHDEIVLFKAVFNWVNQNEAERQGNLCELIHQVRLPVIDRGRFTIDVTPNKHLKECDKCKDYLNVSTMFLVDANPRCLKLYQLRPRARISILSFYCTKLLTFHKNSKLEQNSILPKMPVECKCFSVCYYKGIFYVMGEDNGKRSFSLNVSKGIGNSKWVELPPMPTKRNDHRNFYSPKTLIFRDQILVIGGCVENKRLSTIDAYDIESNTWKDFPSMQIARSAFGCAMLYWTIYVISGLEDNEESSTEIYNHGDGKWEKQCGPNTARYEHSAVSFRGKLYIAGGKDLKTNMPISSVETISEGSWNWTEINPMRYKRAFPAMFISEGEVYVLGGNRDKKSSLWEKFNVNTKLWETSVDKSDTIKEANSFLIPYW